MIRWVHVACIFANAGALSLGAGGHASLFFIGASAVCLALAQPRIA